MKLTPVHSREEYIEQAYLFRTWRERVADGRPTQEVIEHLRHELLSTTQLPFAVEYMLADLKHHGRVSKAVAAMPHYFTPFQTHILEIAEEDYAHFTMEQALLILEREAEYRAGEPSRPGLFVFQLETLSRNRLGYVDGLSALRDDAFYDESWRAYISLVAEQLGTRDFAELIFARSEHFIKQRRQMDPEYEPTFVLLFSEKEGRIADANRGKDPMYLFATLQRQLGYPQVPRLNRTPTLQKTIDELGRKLATLESRFELLESEVRGQVDLSKYYVKRDKGT